MDPDDRPMMFCSILCLQLPQSTKRASAGDNSFFVIQFNVTLFENSFEKSKEAEKKLTVGELKDHVGSQHFEEKKHTVFRPIRMRKQKIKNEPLRKIIGKFSLIPWNLRHRN